MRSRTSVHTLQPVSPPTTRMTQKGKSKSRVGCTACKVKRVKCDETKPECLTCIRRGSICPGYQRELKWSTKYEFNLNDDPNNVPWCLSDLATATLQSVVEDNTQAAAAEDQANTTSPAVPDSKDFSTSPSGVPPVPTPNEAFNISNNAAPSIDFNTDDVTLATTDFQDDYADQDLWPGELWTSDFAMQQLSPTLQIGTTISPMDLSQNDDFTETIERTVSHEDHDTSNGGSKALVRVNASSLRQSLTDMPTFLVDQWFKSVCTVWSGFDSITNMNRKLASDAVTYSDGLFYSLQSMSAAYLADQLPHLRAVALDTAKHAVSAIRRDLVRVNQRSFFGGLPTDLLLSMFCLGTSGCWTDTRQLGLPFLREIKTLLMFYNRQAMSLSVDDQQLLSFFNNSCLYWDMLCRVVADSEDETGPFWSNSPGTELSAKDLLHPWTGVSTNVLELFAESVALCRQFHLRKAHLSRPTTSSLQAALRDIQRAQQLEQSLEMLRLPDEETLPETGDHLTPRSHLVDVAEAYRLASLLQLRQTFPELPNMQIATNGGVETDMELLRLSLAMVKILQRIPLPSGTHCIQPVLYLTASTGLRFDVPVSELEQSRSKIDEIFSPDLRDLSSDTRSDPGSEVLSSTTLHISESSIEVGHARQFVLERLNALEKKLPAKPILVAKELVQRIWQAYDREEPGGERVHWIDVMKETGLSTIFG